MRVFRAMLPMLVVAAFDWALHMDPTFDKYSWMLGASFGGSLIMAYHDGREASEESSNGQL